jgi:dTDP-4-dehydrorhamnose reductase
MSSRVATLELWGGVECTVSRVGDDYVDQLELTGHAHRPGDIDRIASLGVRAVRYPVLWERTAPHGIASADWAWADARLERLRAHGITPILGLMHHGSGPRDTWLGDPAFPVKLAEYARAVAERFPWLQLVTPVNEPLTTARFSGLYGHWYPHQRDDRAFVRMLLNEVQGTRLAMRAIREVAPHAKLVQTDDLGHTHASPSLAYQADFENERRWLAWDLLCGSVTPGHAMYDYLVRSGASPRELATLADDPCPPDLIGIDHYVTSERYLDADVHAYPERCRGGNGIDRYADAEVARARPEQRRGLAALLHDAWERYGIALAVTECHLSCDDEDERVRWLVEAWRAAVLAREAGCDVRAVTAWALFGTCGWNTLSTRCDGQYDAGAFDTGGVAHAEPRDTAVARALRAIAREGWYDDEALTTPGWWQCHTPMAGEDASATMTF